MESPLEGRKPGGVGIRLDPRPFCPQCGCDVTEQRTFKIRGHQMHIDGLCATGHRLWRHDALSPRWFEDWRRIYYGCRCGEASRAVVHPKSKAHGASASHTK